MNISDRLNELMLSYRREARKCLRGKAYLAAMVMQVAAFEAGLQAMCFLYSEQVKRTTVYARKRFRGKRNRALEFSLHQLITIADELGWFPARRIRWAGKRSTLAGYSHEIRKVRNYVHPGVWARDGLNTLKFTKGVYGVADEVIDVANSWLLLRVEKDLLKAMKRAKKKKAERRFQSRRLELSLPSLIQAN
jgi:hypothetical protein